MPEGNVALERLGSIERSEYEAYCYLANIAYLIYATTLLDTFLSETTRFLLLLFPRALGKKQTVPIEILLDSSSRAHIIESTVAKKVRELGHEGFLGRLSFLREQFGLSMNLSDEDNLGLEHFSGIRNALIHDQRVSGLLPVRWTPPYANSAFTSNSMGLSYPSVECRRRGL